MPINDPIELSLQLKFEAEKLSRTIHECDDLKILRAIALELLELNQKKSAIAQWATKRAAEAEHTAFGVKNSPLQQDFDFLKLREVPEKGL